MTAVKHAVAALLDGEQAETVIANMKLTYTTPESMKKHMSLVRTTIMEGNHYSPSFDLAPLRAFSEDPEIAAFATASLKEQCKIQREHKFNPTWSEEAEKCLSELQILPTNMNDFVQPKAEAIQIKRRAAKRLRQKNANVITVNGGEALLTLLTSILETAAPTTNLATLVCALATLSGRRKCELLNGRSTFDAVPEKPTLALFTGQLKTKSTTPRPYVIPLCCTYATFIHGFSTLRAIQERNGGVTHLTNAEVDAKYRYLSAMPALQLPDIHSLRALYIMYVFDNLYECSASFNETAWVCLGHRELTESLHYAGVKIRDCNNITFKFGKLKL